MPIPASIPFPSPAFPVEDIPTPPLTSVSDGPVEDIPTPSPTSASDGHGHNFVASPLYSDGMSPAPTPPPSRAASTIDSLVFYHSDSASDSGYESSPSVMSSTASPPPPYAASIPPSYTSMPSYDSTTQIIPGSIVFALARNEPHHFFRNAVGMTVKNCCISLRNGRVLPAYRMTGFLVSSRKIEIGDALELFLEGESSISVATGAVKMMYGFERESASVALDIVSAGGCRTLLLAPRYVVERDFHCRFSFSELWHLSGPTQVLAPTPTLRNALCLTTPSILDGQSVSRSSYIPDANSPAWRAITTLASDPACCHCGRRATVDGLGPVLHQGQWTCRKRVYRPGSSCGRRPLSLSCLVSTLIGDPIVAWVQRARQRLWPSSPIAAPTSPRSATPP